MWYIKNFLHELFILHIIVLLLLNIVMFIIPTYVIFYFYNIFWYLLSSYALILSYESDQNTNGGSIAGYFLYFFHIPHKQYKVAKTIYNILQHLSLNLVTVILII